MSYKLGSRITIKDDESRTGVVTYIHPSGRWYQVTFDNGVKECFFIPVEPCKLKPDRMKPVGFTKWRTA